MLWTNAEGGLQATEPPKFTRGSQCSFKTDTAAIKSWPREMRSLGPHLRPDRAELSFYRDPSPHHHPRTREDNQPSGGGAGCGSVFSLCLEGLWSHEHSSLVRQTESCPDCLELPERKHFLWEQGHPALQTLTNDQQFSTVCA